MALNAQASSLDTLTAHVLHHKLDEGIHYLVVDNTKEFGETKPTGDVEVELSINVLSQFSPSALEPLGQVVVPTWMAAVVLALLLASLGTTAVLGCLLLTRQPRSHASEAGDTGLIPGRRMRLRGSPIRSARTRILGTIGRAAETDKPDRTV